MPKMKTRRSAAKRFSLTGSGKIKHGAIGKRHKLSSKNRKRKLSLQGNRIVERPNVKQIKRMLCCAAKG